MILKRKVTYVAAIVVAIVFLIGLVIYFKPLSLLDIVSEDHQITLIISELGVRNGEAYMDSVPYQSITSEQKSSILALLEQYTYTRTLTTPFSDGSLRGLGNRVLYINVYDDTSLVDDISVTSLGKIAVNGKNYNMKDAEQFIEQVSEIME